MPASSAHCATGSTTSAIAAVSDRKASHHHQQVERARAAPRRGRRRARRPPRCEPMHQQRADLAGAERVQQFVGGRARAAAASSGSTPQTAATAARCARVVDVAVAGQLIGLLPVLAPALAVALAGQAAVAAAGLPALPSASIRLIKASDIVGALGSAARRPRPVSTMRVAASAEQCAGLRSWRSRHAGDALDPLRPVGGARCGALVEPVGARGDVVLVDQPLADRRCAAARWPARGRCRA